MYKKIVNILCVLICVGVTLFLLTSCTDPDEPFFRNNDNYVQFEGNIVDVGVKEIREHNYIWVKIESICEIINFNLEFHIVPTSYNDLINNGFVLSASEQKYTFVTSKEPKSYLTQNRYCIIGVYDNNGNIYLDKERGKANLLYDLGYGS